LPVIPRARIADCIVRTKAAFERDLYDETVRRTFTRINCHLGVFSFASLILYL
jgi:hypothetical protein